MPSLLNRGTRFPLRLIAAGAAVACLAAAAGCSSPARTYTLPASADPNVVVAAVPATGAAGLYIAQDEGLFKRAGLNVTISSSVSAANTIPDLMRGQVDVTLGQWTSAIAVAAHGNKLRALESGNAGGPGLEELVTYNGSSITKPSELRGGTIAVNAIGGLSQILCEAALLPYGITSGDVHWAVTSFPTMGAGLAEHKFSAAFMVEPYLSNSEQREDVSPLIDLDAGSTQGFPITGYFTTQEWVERNPATAAAFTRVLEQGQQIAATSRSAVEQAMIKHLGITPVTASVMSLGSFPIGVDPVQLLRVADLMQSHGLLPPRLSLQDVIGKLTS